MARLVVLQHIGIEGPGLFFKVAKEENLILKIIRVDLGEKLPLLKASDILLIMGGPMGIKDINESKYAWLKKELDYIKDALNKDIGIIGVCLGAQLLAHAAGGDVEILTTGNPSKPFPEIGWSPISSSQKNSKNKLINFLEKPIYVLHWHKDRILLPINAELIASSNRCREQFFKIGDRAYGLQFHIETTLEMAKKWIIKDKKILFSALGPKGVEIVKDQSINIGVSNEKDRIKFIKILFKELTNKL